MILIYFEVDGSIVPSLGGLGWVARVTRAFVSLNSFWSIYSVLETPNPVHGHFCVSGIRVVASAMIFTIHSCVVDMG